MHRAARCWIVVVALGSPLPALADPAAAEALFQQGRALLERGELEAACAKFESSQASEPSAGTLLNLADCRARQGKTATAWAHFVAAERLSEHQSRPEQAAEARRRRAELEPSLSTITVQTSDPPTGLEVRVNGRALDSASLDTRLPMDPGMLSIEFSAPGRVASHVESELRPSGHHLLVKVPQLASEEAAAMRPESSPGRVLTSSDAGRQPRSANTLAWIVGGAGVAALAVGGTFGVMALSSNATAKSACDQRTTDCPSRALNAEQDRDREALISTIGIAAGLVGVGVSAVMLLASPSPVDQSRASPGLRLELSPGKALISGSTRF